MNIVLITCPLSRWSRLIGAVHGQMIDEAFLIVSQIASPQIVPRMIASLTSVAEEAVLSLVVSDVVSRLSVLVQVFFRGCVPGVGFEVFGLWLAVYGFRVSGFGFRISGCGCWVSSYRFLVSGFWFRVSDFGFQVSGFGFRVSGFGFQVSGFVVWFSGFGFQVPGFGFRVSGFR
jgi:hypothetical protein